AAILLELKKPLVIEEIEAPPLRFGQVLVKILCSGICGAQINEIEGAKGPDKFLPHLLGHEATATVVDCGEGVTTVKAGHGVVGAGGVGLNIVQFAAMVAAHPIIAIDLHDHKLELATRLGATHTLNANHGRMAEEIRRIVGDQGVDVAVDNTGVADVIETAYN